MNSRDTPFSFPQYEGQPEFAWIDQLTQEMLLTVQAFNRLQQVLTGKFFQGKS